MIPKFLIARSALPLAYLASGQKEDGSSGTRIFTAQLSLLEGALQQSSGNSPILIAQSRTPKNTLYAIESVTNGLYALCMLADWVTIQTLEQLHAAGSYVGPKQKRRLHRINPQDYDWWRDAAVLKPIHRFAGKKASSSTGVQLSFERSRPVELDYELGVSKLTSPPALESSSTAPKSPADLLALNLAYNPEQAMSALLVQYQEALYFSKVGPSVSGKHGLV